MSILYLLVPVAIGIVLAALGGFAWATRGGQFDDLETPALRAIRDDAGPERPSSVDSSAAVGSVKLEGQRRAAN